MGGFEGFGPADFDAYAPDKWRSNVYNLERLRVKEKLARLAEHLAPLWGGDPPLTWELSAEHPALWNNHQVKEQSLFFLRPEEDRQKIFRLLTRARGMAALLQEPAPQMEHVHLVVSVHHEGLTCGLSLQPEATVDHRNLLEKLKDPWQKAELRDVVSGLDRRFRLSVGGRAVQDASAVAEQLEQTKVDPDQKDPILFVWMVHGRDAEELGGPGAADLVLGELRALLPLYRFVAWSRGNDFLRVLEQEKKEKERIARRGLRPKDRVRILAGPLAGKQGVVQSIDGKGQATVVVGTFTLQVPVDDLAQL